MSGFEASLNAHIRLSAAYLLCIATNHRTTDRCGRPGRLMRQAERKFAISEGSKAACTGSGGWRRSFQSSCGDYRHARRHRLKFSDCWSGCAPPAHRRRCVIDLKIFHRRESAIDSHHMRSSIDQRDITDAKLAHLNSSAAVSTDCAISTIFLFSFMAVLRISA